MCAAAYPASVNESSRFALFRARFFSPTLHPSFGGSGNEGVSAVSSRRGGEALAVSNGGSDAASGEVRTVGRPALALDLQLLPKDDGPPSETQLRRQKFAYFDKHCSEIEPGLFLAGDTVARNRAQLAEHGITHVVNCVGFICPEYFKGQGIEYKTYFLQGVPGVGGGAARWLHGAIQ
jgi:hypothetical protein